MYQPSLADILARGPAQRALHEHAADATREMFGGRVFVRAVVEVSNFCRESCRYCGMRRENRSLARFRLPFEPLAEHLLENRPASVTEINLQAGEDPVVARELVLPLVRLLRRETNLGIIVCLGTLDDRLYADLREAGAEVYIMKFEVADPDRYAALSAPGTLAERLAHIRTLARDGWLVSSGFIAGLPGQPPEELLAGIRLAAELPLVGCSVSPFVAGPQTPLHDAESSPAEWTFNCLAALRRMRPDWVIPAVSALNLAAEDGYRRGLRAGANLVTINLTPTAVRDDYVIYKRDRFIMTEARVLAALADEGLEPSPVGWVEHLSRRTPPVATP
ncbi:MAG: radical SAM protein [Verrucomicrobiales bacterium]|nr:radical SAM protein [Verrucomicrobiales bacterium]